VVGSVRLDEGEGTEAFNDCSDSLGARESLKEFLEYESSCYDYVRTGERLNQSLYFWLVRRCVTAEGERPDARIDKEAHFRDRSAL